MTIMCPSKLILQKSTLKYLTSREKITFSKLWTEKCHDHGPVVRVSVFIIRTEVRWAGKNVTKMFRVHVFGASFLDVSFELLKTLSPSLPAGLHITILLHGNNTEMIFFVDPDLKINAIS